jgi:hypothetical protein
MLMREFPLPSDANRELGSKLNHNSLRKRHEVVASAFGTDQPYACKSAPLREWSFTFQMNIFILTLWPSSCCSRYKSEIPEARRCLSSS